MHPHIVHRHHQARKPNPKQKHKGKQTQRQKHKQKQRHQREKLQHGIAGTKTLVACAACRRRKTRCGIRGKDGRCATCRDTNRDCTYMMVASGGSGSVGDGEDASSYISDDDDTEKMCDEDEDDDDDPSHGGDGGENNEKRDASPTLAPISTYIPQTPEAQTSRFSRTQTPSTGVMRGQGPHRTVTPDFDLDLDLELTRCHSCNHIIRINNSHSARTASREPLFPWNQDFDLLFGPPLSNHGGDQSARRGDPSQPVSWDSLFCLPLPASHVSSANQSTTAEDRGLWSHLRTTATGFPANAELGRTTSTTMMSMSMGMDRNAAIPTTSGDVMSPLPPLIDFQIPPWPFDSADPHLDQPMYSRAGDEIGLATSAFSGSSETSDTNLFPWFRGPV